MSTGIMQNIELNFYNDDPYYCLYGSDDDAFDESDIGEVVRFTFSDGTTFKSDPIYVNDGGQLIVKFNVVDDYSEGTPISYPALYICNGSVYYYPTSTPDSVFINSEFYVPQEKFLNNNGLAHLWDKIKSYVNGRTTDYIVEEGTSGNWSYTKWNSGRIELINKSYSFSNLSWTTWGNLYYAKPSVPIPSGLLNSTDYIANVFCNQGNFFMVCSVYTKAKTSFVPVLARPSSTTSSSATIQIIGTWK